jgi:hypothetical protein
MIISRGYNHKDFVLVDLKSNPVAANTEHNDFRGDVVTLLGGRAPHKSGSTGRVWVKLPNGITGEFFPSVIDLVWVPLVSEAEA